MTSSVTGNFTPLPPDSGTWRPQQMADPVTDLTGIVVLGRYRLEHRIDAGATGTVYRAHDLKRKRAVAVKVLHAHHARNRRVVDAFAREARAAERMIHPNLVQVHGLGHDPAGYLCIVMELLEGRTLERLLADLPMPPVPWTLRVVAQVLDALDAAHDAGVVHRDTKPANVFILSGADDGSPRVKLCDFGVARIRRSSTEMNVAHERRRGGAERVWGTPEYMAPEQARAETVDRTSDIYACGVMLYEMVTGRLPFEGRGEPQEVALQHVERQPVPPTKLHPELDPALESIILRAMAKDPAQRFRNAQAMRSALLVLLQHDVGMGPTPTRRFRRPTRYA